MKPILFFILISFLFFDATAQTTNGVIILPDPLVTGQKTRNAIAVDKNDIVWMGFKNFGLGKFANGTWTLYDSLNNGLLSNTVYAHAVDAANNIWVGTKRGLQQFNGTILQSFTTANSGLINDTISALYIKGNTIYIGTNAGLSIFDGSTWTNYTTGNSNLIGDSISAIAVTDNNDKYFGTHRGLSCLAANGSWFNFDSASAGIDNKINALITNGNVLYVGANSTSYKLSNNIIQSFETFFPCTEGSNYGTYSFAKTSTGKIYFGYSLKTFYEMENNNLKRYYLKPYLSQIEFAITSKDSLYLTSTKFQGSNSFAKFELSTYVNPELNDTMKFLDINDVKALIANEGMMHWDRTNSQYFVPKCSGKGSVFSSALWIGGLDDNNQLHLAAQTYRQTGADFFAGPVDTVTHIADSVSHAFYNKIWKVERNEIEEFKYQFALGNVANNSYVIPTDVLTWPANGILNNAKTLAPYIDVNQDGKYDAHDGDYPDIRGDQFLYWIFNDTMRAHKETGGVALGVEVHASAYAYDCPELNDTDNVMNLTTFYQYKFINRSGVDYHNMYIGLWCDNDLGKATDDFVGCDTTLDIGFAYNGDNNDDGYGGYGLNPPMQNVLILKGPVAANADNKDNNHNGLIDEAGETLGITSFMYYGGFGWNENPQSPIDFYRYMKSTWLDGVHLTFGQYGHNLGNPLIDYMFPGTPYDTLQWSETSLNNTPEDRRFIMSCGPFNLNANDTATIDFAYVFTRDETAPNGLTTSIARNIKDVKKIINWYKNDNFPSCITNTFPPIDTSNTLIIFPNPANDLLQFSLQLHSSSPQFFIYDLLGQKIISGVTKSKIINIKSLSHGVYFLKIKDGDKEFVQKFLKAL